MAIEAIFQYATLNSLPVSVVTSYHFREVQLTRSIILTEEDPTEMSFVRRPRDDRTRSSARSWLAFTVYSWTSDNGWSEHCQGFIKLTQEDEELNAINGSWSSGLQKDKHNGLVSRYQAICQEVLDPAAIYDRFKKGGSPVRTGFPEHNSSANDAESHASFIAISADDPSDVLVKAEDVVGTRLPTTTIEPTTERDLRYSMQWAVCTELLSQEQFSATFSSPGIDPLPQLEKLERGAFYYMQRLLGELAADNVPPQFQKLYASMASLYTKAQDNGLPFQTAEWLQSNEDEQEKFLGDLDDMDDCGQLLGAIRGNLLPIMEETIEPISIVQHKNKLEKYYLNIDILRRGNDIAAAVVSNLASQNPNMRILEIGGASAATTTRVLEALGSRFVSCHFTVATPKYLDNAKEACNAWGDKMNYTIFDIGKNALEQDWSRSEEPKRQEGSCLSESQWASVLKTTGFSGIDASVQFSPGGTDTASVVLSTACSEYPPALVQAASEQVASITDQPGITTGHLTDVKLDDQYGIVLALDTPFWSDIREDDLEKIQKLISSARGLLWVTRGAQAANPVMYMVHGFARTIRLENAGFRFVTLDLEEQQVHPEAHIIDTIMKVFKHSFVEDNKARFCDEMEFTEIDGMLQISRALLDRQKDHFIMHETYEPVAEPQPFHQPGRPLTLTVGQ
ncbi:MAG: hypothetical protein Q9180_005984, partial [Flavoplaca navasiana]